jgi:hypothetical protein
MRSRRKGNRRSWTPYTSRLAHEAKARKRLEGGGDGVPRRLAAGVMLGVLQWHGVDGVVKRVVVRQGKRANSIRVSGMGRDIGWDRLFRKMRSRLSMRKV